MSCFVNSCKLLHSAWLYFSADDGTHGRELFRILVRYYSLTLLPRKQNFHIFGFDF